MYRKNNFLLRHTTFIGTLTVGVFLLLTLGIFYRQDQAFTHIRGWMVHSYNVNQHIHQLFDALQDGLRAQRGYALSGDESYLKCYDHVADDAPSPNAQTPALPSACEIHGSVKSEMAQLRALTADNQALQHELNTLDQEVQALLDYMAEAIRQQQSQGSKKSGVLFDPQAGNESIDRIHATIIQLSKEENELMTLRAEADAMANRHNGALVFSCIALFYSGMLFMLLLAVRQARYARRMELEASQANIQLNESRGFLKNIINHIPDPIFVKDAKHRWIEGNDALWALFGKPEAELLGKSDYDFFPKEEADVFWRKDEEVFNGGGNNTNTEHFTDAMGVTHIISTRKTCFHSAAGEAILVGVIRDITELTQAQEKLKQSDEARIKSIMDHSARVLSIKNLDGHYVQVNHPLLEMLGRKEEEVIGKTDYDIFPKHYAEVSEQNELAVLSIKKAVEYEEIIPRPDGPHTYRTVKFPLYDASEQIYALCSMSTDITERKAAEAELLRYMRELERSNQELDDFAYIASHDLKEPLRGLHNHASFLLEDYADKLDEDGVRRLNRLSQLSQRMERLVNDLLYFSRLGRSDLAIQESDPNLMVCDIKQMLESFLKEHNARIIIPEPMPKIVCDTLRVTEVFRNLVTNAIKYNDKPEKIVEVGFMRRMTAPHGVEYSVFYVRDNGIGIEKEFHEQIFRIFKRLQPAAEKETGTGVGLTFVKKIVERHNGRIWLESTPKNGSTFYFTTGKKDL